MLAHFGLLFLALTGLASASECSTDEKRVVVYADKKTKCLRQKNGSCFKEVVGEAYAYLYNPDYLEEGSARRLFGCSACFSVSYYERYMCQFYGCGRRELEEQEDFSHTLRGNRELSQSLITTPVDIGILGNFGLVILGGKSEATFKNSPVGFFGDIFVNGITATEKYSGPFSFEGTIYTTSSTMDEHEALVLDNPDTANVETDQVALGDELREDFDLSIQQIAAMEPTPGFGYVHAACGLDMVNFKNGIAEVVVMNIRDGFKIESPVHILGDEYDLIILRWDDDGDMSNGINGKVEFKGSGGIYPAGGLTPDRLIHVAAEIKSGPGTVDELVTVGEHLLPNTGFFIGNWLVTGKVELTNGGNIVGGLYSTVDSVQLEKANMVNYVLGVSWFPEEDEDHDVFEESPKDRLDLECWETIGILEDIEFTARLKERLEGKYAPDIEFMTFQIQCKKKNCVDDE